jgi:hypothetical protein
LADHLACTAREPELLPRTDDVHALLGHCLLPRDIDLQSYLRRRFLEMRFAREPD